MQCCECLRILALKDDSSVAWNVFEELEAHFSRDHFQLNIYNCPICFEEKFPTEYKLIEHFANSHKNQSTIKVSPVSHSIRSDKHTTSHNKQRKIKLSREVNMPPRPVSAYLLFSNANRSVIEHMAKEKNSSYDSMLRDLWNDPQHTDKQHWKDKYIKKRDEYKKELKIRKLKDSLTNQ